jgi:hypothetical protein
MARYKVTWLAVLAIEHQVKVIIATTLIRLGNREFIFGEVKSQAFFFSVPTD